MKWVSLDSSVTGSGVHEPGVFLHEQSLWFNTFNLSQRLAEPLSTMSFSMHFEIGVDQKHESGLSASQHVDSCSSADCTASWNSSVSHSRQPVHGARGARSYSRDEVRLKERCRVCRIVTLKGLFRGRLARAFERSLKHAAGLYS